jgi:tyrosyl-tRNA synthetase
MSAFKSDFLRVLDERGFIHQISDPEGLDALFKAETVSAYIGFDPTAPSLHAGGLIQIMMLHWMQQTGHRPIALMGGSDQWGNIINGIDLGHRMETPQLFALTSPLLTTSSGAKMGKSLNGAVWLNADMLSPYEFWQYWRTTEDADVERFLRLYTTMPLDEVARLAALGGSEINEAKKVLATEVTAMLHGRADAEQAAETARKTFEEGVTADTLPTVTVDRAAIAEGVGILSLFVSAGLASSNGEARRHVQGGAVRVNDQPVADDRRIVTEADVTADGAIKLSLGKKRHVLVRPS